VKEVNAQGTTILMVEQNALAALDVARYAYVLESGKIKLEGPRGRAGHERRGPQGLPGRGLSGTPSVAVGPQRRERMTGPA
jgi:energy-coupling factor transporter ATP-binding protein EcfA2